MDKRVLYVIEQAASIIKPFEGCHRIGKDGLVYPYMCPAGYPTQGWGIVVASMDVPPITQEEADARLYMAIPGYVLAALRLSPILAGHLNKLAAVTSFIYNLGEGRYRASTLRRLIDAGRFEEAAEEFPKWKWGGGRVLPGLVKRRAAERQMFLEE